MDPDVRPNYRLNGAIAEFWKKNEAVSMKIAEMSAKANRIPEKFVDVLSGDFIRDPVRHGPNALLQHPSSLARVVALKQTHGCPCPSFPLRNHVPRWLPRMGIHMTVRAYRGSFRGCCLKGNRCPTSFLHQRTYFRTSPCAF
eukprot:5356661-Amphidinium_carterae.1